MIGIVIVSHSNIASEFLSVLEHIVGKQENIEAISIFPDDDVEKKRKEIIKAIKNVDQNKGVVVLTDMFGGTPSITPPIPFPWDSPKDVSLKIFPKELPIQGTNLI